MKTKVIHTLFEHSLWKNKSYAVGGLWWGGMWGSHACVNYFSPTGSLRWWLSAWEWSCSDKLCCGPFIFCQTQAFDKLSAGYLQWCHYYHSNESKHSGFKDYRAQVVSGTNSSVINKLKWEGHQRNSDCGHAELSFYYPRICGRTGRSIRGYRDGFQFGSGFGHAPSVKKIHSQSANKLRMEVSQVVLDCSIATPSSWTQWSLVVAENKSV